MSKTLVALNTSPSFTGVTLNTSPSSTLVALNTSPSSTLVNLNTSPSFSLVSLPTSITWLTKGFWASFNINNWEDTNLNWEEAGEWQYIV